MEDDERLREALLELETLRAREAERLRETQAILSAVEMLAGSADVGAGLAALLSSIAGSLGCDGVALLEASGDRLELRLPAPSAPAPAWEAPGLSSRARRIVDLQAARGPWAAPPDHMGRWRSLLSVPLRSGEQTFVLAAHADVPGHFGARDAELLGRLARFVGEAILRRGLERRNAFLASVIDRSPGSVAIAEASGDLPLVYVNDAFTRLSGYDRDEVLGSNCRLMTAEPADAPVRAAIRAALDARRDGTFLLRNRRKDGTIFWNQLRLFPIEDEAGAATHVVATQADVTARVQAETDRDHARRRLQDALEATSEAFLILGRAGHVRYTNASFDAILGPDAPEADAMLPHALAARLLGQAEAVVPDPPILAFDVPVSREFTGRDGRQLLLRARPIPDGGAVIAISDVTQLKVNERALRQRLAAIERSQDGIAIGDAEGRVINVNPSLVALWGLDGEADALGRRWTAFYDRDTSDAFAEGAEGGDPRGAFRGTAEIDLPGGRRTHELSLSLVPDVGSILVVRDVTERMLHEAERDALRLALDRAAAQARLHQASAGLAHDFNNLLSAIQGSTALLEASDLPDPARAASARIQSAAGRAAELVEGLLDLGARERVAAPLDLVRVVRSTVDLARGGAPSTARILTDLPDGPLMVEASQTDLLQVVMNLTVNAVDALGGAPGGVRVALRGPVSSGPGAAFVVGSATPGQGYAVIDVIDTGEGMDPETFARVLEPYFTTKGDVGTGLGLSIVATLVSEAGGMLDIDSAPGRGTRMSVWWPVDRPARPDRTGSRATGHARAGCPILVLDDLPEVAASHAAILSEAGFEVAELDDPTVALETVAEDPEGWGCLVTDYDMPGLTAGDLIEHLETAAPDLPVVVVSALARRLTDRRLERAAAVLPKPLSADRLVAAVSAVTQGEEP